MNQLISASNGITMSSLEMAELTEKRHDSVIRTINDLVHKEIIQPPQFVEVKNERNQSVKSYEVCKRDSFVVVARLSPEFTARLVDRWQELETQLSQPKIPQNYAEALQLAADQAKQLEIAAPKADFYDRVVERETLINATQVAQKVGLSAVMMNRALDEIGGVYSKSTKRGRVFIQEFIHKGYGILRMTESGHAQPLFTTAGEARVIELLTNEGCI